MLRLLGLAVSIGLADSLNPSTIGPALYLAAGGRPRRQVVEFTLGVVAVYFVGGALLLLGPGQLLLSLLPHPSHHVRYIIETAVGAALIGAALLLAKNRRALAQREAPRVPGSGRSSALLGASITALELPTAFPYFAMIAALVGSGLGPIRQLALLAIFNLCFVLPLVGIVALVTVAGERAVLWLGRGREYLDAHWPQLLAGLLLLAGVFVLLLGVTGLGQHKRNDFGGFSRGVRKLLPH